jgi:Predicted permeases
MLSNLLTVGGQAFVLFLLILVGFACGKTKLIGPAAVSGMTSLALYVVIPCTLISAFQLELTPDTLRDFLISAAAAVCIHALNFFLSQLTLRERDGGRKRVLVMASTFSNCNFMAFPLQTALIGSMGIFYGSAYAMVTPLLFWTAGVAYLSGNTRSFSLRQAVVNPGILGIAAGLFLFFTGITLPDILESAVDHLASMAVPLPMIIIGCQLADTDLRHALRDRMGWMVALLRLLALPLAELGLLYLVGIRGNVLVATVIAASAPPAAIVAMLAERCGQNPRLAAELVSLQTLMSILTMPFVVALAQLLA